MIKLFRPLAAALLLPFLACPAHAQIRGAPGIGLPTNPPPIPKVKIAAGTPVEALVPKPPRFEGAGGPLVGDDLSQVPEVALNHPWARDKKLALNMARQKAAVLHLDRRNRDGFVEALVESRADLAGLPFLKGDACRTPFKLMERFLAARAILNSAGNAGAGQDFTGNPEFSFQFGPAQNFWATARRALSDLGDDELSSRGKVAVFMQMCGPETQLVQKGMTRALSEVGHADASRALAKMALFAPEEDVRRAAIEALKVRRDKDYGDVLVGGLRYPWPAVARRAAEAIARLERKDLIPALLTTLEEADPRLPQPRRFLGKDVDVVRELVRVNHHRNCLLCHAPGDPTELVEGAQFAFSMPLPDQPLPFNSEGYNQNFSPELAVRIDVTYLRQDFSVMQRVVKDDPWPEMQRFDFLVRQRAVSPAEAAAYRKALDLPDDGSVSPYHRAALYALREVTGRDTEPTATAWRRMLKMPRD